MPQFFSMDEFMQHVEQALELEDAYEETHDESLLEVEIELWQRIFLDPLFKHMPQDFQALAYGKAGQSFFYRYHLDRKRMGDLERAGHLFSEALLHVSDAALRAVLLHSLGDVETNFYQQRGKLADLEQSIAHYRAATAHIEPDDIDVPVYLGFMDDLGTALRDHYIHTWNVLHLDESIKIHQEVLKIAARFSSNPARYSNHLGNALLDRYEHLEEIEDLQQAIEAFQRALTYSPEGDPARPGYLSNLGNALSHRSKHLNDITDLERALQLQREAVSLAPRDAYFRTNLGIDLGSYYTWAGRQEAIDESITIFEKIIEDENTFPPSPDLPDYHANLAISLLHRYDGRADREDLRRALHHYTLALELAACSSTQEEQKPLLLDASARPSYLYGLAGALLASYLAIGRVADLKEAIERLHEALRLLPPTAVSMQAEYRRGLSNLLIHLYDREHQLEQLDEAITFTEYGVQQLDARSPQLARMYNAQGTALRHRYLAAHNRADIYNAIAAFYKALAVSPADSPELSVIHTNLDQIFLGSEPLETTATSITLDIVSEEEATRGDPLPQKKILEGRITLDPQKSRIYALSPLAEPERLRLQTVKSATWDFYLVILPFTLHKAPGNNSYQSMTFFIELTTPDVSAFDLFPKNVTSPIDNAIYYTVSADMQISEVGANTQQDGLRIHFEALHPFITAFGEGEKSFYWMYQTNRQQREVHPGTRHTLIVLQAPRGTQMVDGVVSYEIKIAKSFFGQRLTIESEVEPYPIHWKLDEAMPASPLKPSEEKLSSTEKQREINLFYACASEDEMMRKDLEKHLATLRRQGWIREWHELDVEAGRPRAEVNDFLERSQIILLLISPDLLAPDGRYKDLVERALKMQDEGKTRLIPILLRPTGDLQHTPLGHLVMLPRNNVSVSEWRSRDKAFEEIVGEIREIIKRNFGV